MFLVLLGVAWCTACKGPAAPEVDASVPDAAANPDCTRGEPDCASLVIGEESYARSVTAEEVLRTDVTGYGDIQSPDEFGRRLRAITERQRTGEILLQINPLLRRLTQEPSGDYATQLGTLLADVLALAQEIVDTGGTVRFQLTCATPIWLSDTPFPHDTTTGANRASDQPVYACSPPNDAAEWTRIVRAVAELFTPMADRVAFTVGGEPETYFAGDRDQLFAWYRSTVEGVRASTRGAEMRVGGITVAFHRTSDLRKTQPVETGGAVTFTEVDYGEPLTQSWIRYCGENGLPIDLVTIHQFAGSPTPSVGTFWSHARRDITAWLEESGFDPATVELGIEDWPNWVPYPSNDTEYFAAHMIAGVLSMLDLSLRGGMQVRPLQAFLYDYGFRPEGRFLAGFTGVPGMTNEQWIIEPVYNADSLMAEVRGVVTPVRSDDPFVHAVAAQDGETWTLLVSNFIPLELERDPLYDTYHQRPIAANHFIEEDVSDVD
ncbi:MAG: hypothetical protein R3B82_25395, partial [Sandaracinaceae bacterium]